MNFFESEYYTPIQKKEVPSKYQKMRDISYIQYRSGEGLSISILETYCKAMPNMNNLAMQRDRVVEEWTLVNDLTFYVNSITDEPEFKGNLSDMLSHVYFDPCSKMFAVVVDAGQDVIGTEHIYCPFNVNPEIATKQLLSCGILCEYTEPRSSKIGVLIKTNYGFSIEYNDIKHEDINFDTMYNEDFTEVSKEVVENIAKDSNKGIIILHGLPGTGKTNYLRWLTGQTDRKMVFIPTNLVGSLTEPVFMEFLLEMTGLTFIIEDAEDSLVQRAGGRNSVVSTILNLTDGLLGDVLKCQFICTFNTEIDKIDKALLRPGRLLASYEFNKLTVKTANAYLSSIGSVSTVDKPLTLSELINRDDLPTQSAPKVKRSIGFTSS